MLFYDVAHFYLFLVLLNCSLETRSRTLLGVFSMVVVSTNIIWLAVYASC